MASKVFISSLVVALFLIQSAAACSSCGTEVKSSSAYCPVGFPKLGVCVDLLKRLLHLVTGQSPSQSQCCPLLRDLAGHEANACLCIAAKADVMFLNVDLDAKLNLLANACGRKIPQDYKCQ